MKEYLKFKQKMLKIRSEWFVNEFQRFALQRDIDLIKVMEISDFIKAIGEREPISNKDMWMKSQQNFKDYLMLVPKNLKEVKRTIEEAIKDIKKQGGDNSSQT